jgi:HK97 family phage major capsid protein
MTDSALTPSKIGIVLPFSKKLARATDGRDAQLFQRDMPRAAALGEDLALLDEQAAVSGGRPASILFGVSATGAGSPADLEDDIKALIVSVRGGNLIAPRFVTNGAGVRSLATVRDATGGQRLFPDVTLDGGTLMGWPVVVSHGCPDYLILVDADAIHVVDDGIEIDTTRTSALQLDSAPTAGAQNMTSMFQSNTIAIRLVRWIGWRKAYSDAAGFVSLPIGSPA